MAAPDGLKHVIEGRIQALANVHALFVQSRWTGAELGSLVMQELSPYCQDAGTRVLIDGPKLLLEPSTAQTMAVSLHELATQRGKVRRPLGSQRPSSRAMVACG